RLFLLDSSRRMRRAIFTCLWLLCAVPGTYAQGPADERIDPDRPDITTGTHVVQPGLLQIEAGGIYTRNSSTEHAFASPFTVRVGVRNWIEARVGADGLLSETAGSRRVTGFGNVQVGAKLRLLANSEG